MNAWSIITRGTPTTVERICANETLEKRVCTRLAVALVRVQFVRVRMRQGVAKHVTLLSHLEQGGNDASEILISICCISISCINYQEKILFYMLFASCVI